MAGLDQFHRQLDAGGAAADDHQVQPRRRVAHLGLVDQRHGLEHGQAELLGVLGGVERDGVLGRARGIEEVGGAAQRQRQRVVGQFAARQHFLALAVGHGVHGDLAALAVDADQLALREGKPVQVGQHQVGQAFLVDVQRARRRFMQRRLPDVERPAVDQGDVLAAVDAAELGGQFKAAGTPADDDDTFRGGWRRIGHHGSQYRGAGPWTGKPRAGIQCITKRLTATPTQTATVNSSSSMTAALPRSLARPSSG